MSVKVFLLLLFIAIGTCDDHAPNAVSYNSETFNTKVQKVRHFVMFYAPWCGHCKRAAPIWDDLAAFFNKELEMAKLVIAKVDCTVETALCAQHDVAGYPTFRYFANGPSESLLFRGDRSMRGFQDFLEEQFTLEETAKEEASSYTSQKPLGPLVELTDESFEHQIATGNTFVKFYAPWCGHCKKLAPTWESLAKEFEHDTSVTIAKVDCTLYKPICGKHNVRGYPTLIFFKDGEKEPEFSSRDLYNLKNYVINMINKKNDNADEIEGKIPDDIRTEQGQEPVPTVFPLDQDTFPEVVAEGVTFVKFYAPWCGHCKRLAPVWDDLSTKFEGSDFIRIAKVDCTVEKLLCKLHKVRGYPTLLLFKDGDVIGEYSGARDVGSLESYVLKEIKKRDEL